MRVLMVSDFYAPYVGGVEQHVRSLGHTLAARGHGVTVVTTATSEAPPGAVDDGEVVVERIRTLSGLLRHVHADPRRPWAPPVPDPVATVAIGRLIRRWRPDIVHGHDWLARSAAPWCGRRGPVLVTTYHYYTRTCARKDLWRLDQPCDGPTVARCTRCATATYGLPGATVVALTRIGARLEDARTAEAVTVSEATTRGNELAVATVIPNPVADEQASSALGRSAATGTWNSTALADRRYLLYVGDQRPPKGFPILLDAYRRLDNPPPLVVVGDRAVSDPEEVDGVIRTGPLPHASVRSLMAGALFVVVPSVWAEPFGLVAVEAMAEGRPVVASDTGGLSGLVVPERSGVLVPPGDPGALAQVLRDLLANPDRIERLAQGAAASSRAFAAGTVAASVEAVYRNALVQRGRTPHPVRRE